MRNFICFSLIGLLVFGICFADGKSASPSSFVRDQIEKYEARYGDRGAFSRILGYGTGQYLDRDEEEKATFEWFAYTNTDALIIFIFDRNFLSDEEVAKVEEVDDVLNRSWEVIYRPEKQKVMVITTSNDWIFPYVAEELYDDKWEKDLKFVLDAQTRELSKLSFLKLTISQYMR